ncbi:MAG TPA: FmdB family zinc ribbon protein [Anaeromyxobacteraceae bacterium]|nr:FmdB family zinc ribbon protein [Anaeromyxobacteraceae bacterium]
MPEYAFYCRACKKPFTALMTIAQHDRGVAACPRCKQRKAVEKRLAAAFVVTARKS